MRKSTIFISAVLSTFALAVLYGIVYAYRTSTPVSEVSALTAATSMPEPTFEPTATSVMLTPEQAAQLAAQVVGNTALLSAESSRINGVDAYLITFTNHDMVYVGLDGQILAVQVAPVVMDSAPVIRVKHSKNNDGGGGENHADHEEHEEHEEHDD